MPPPRRPGSAPALERGELERQRWRWERSGRGLAAVVDHPVRLDRVATLELVFPPVLREVDREALGLPDPRRGTRHGRDHRVDQRRHAAVGPAVGLHDRRHLVADGQRAPALGDLVRDRCAHHVDDLADELRQIGERAAELAGERVEDGLHLLVRRPVVDEQHLLPVPGQHVPRDERHGRERQPAHVDPADPAAVEVVCHHRAASPVVGVLPDPAGTQHVAIACLEQRALELVARRYLLGLNGCISRCHASPPSVGTADPTPPPHESEALAWRLRMADLQPLRTLRYEPGAVGSLSDVIAPPYDVIDDAMRADLAARSPYNVVHIDLPPSYGRAAATMRDWRTRGVLIQEDEPAVWVLRQDYTAPDGARRSRTGFFARLRVDEYGPGRIRPHERTHPGPKE